MQLAVDIGNTRVKTGLFWKRELISASVSGDEAVYAVKREFDSQPGIQAIIISSVRNDSESMPIPETIHHIFLNAETKLPLRNLYSEVQSLGRDRIAAAAGASALFPGRNCLVIDCGTCVTMDLVSRKGEFLGGSISPGLRMRLKSMHEGTARLPLVEFDGRLPEATGRNTAGSMLSGSVNGLLNEIYGAISRRRTEFEGLQVLLTGGDAALFEDQLKMDIFADPNLVLRGLNEILLHNLPEK